MILLLLVCGLVTGRLFLLGQLWLGEYAPDPTILVAVLCALALPPRRMVFAAVLLGWGRAVVLLEPAGGQVLCAWGAMAVVAGLRSQLQLLEGTGYVLGCVIGAGCWSLVARGLQLVADQPLTGGRELLLGAALALPIAGLAHRLGAGAGATA